MADLPGTTRLWSEVQDATGSPATRAAPTTVDEGMSLENVDGFRVMVSAASGETLSGAGNLRAYLWDTDLAAWIRNPELDIAVTTSGQRRLVFADQEVKVPSGRVLYAADGITFSAGTAGVTVQIKAWLRSTRG